jgi:hypothetical protein
MAASTPAFTASAAAPCQISRHVTSAGQRGNVDKVARATLVYTAEILPWHRLRAPRCSIPDLPGEHYQVRQRQAHAL